MANMKQRIDETDVRADLEGDCPRADEDAGARGLYQGFFASVLDALATIADLLFDSRTNSPWLTTREGERYAHVAHGVIRHAINSGELPAHQRKQGSVILIRTRDLDAWIESWDSPKEVSAA